MLLDVLKKGREMNNTMTLKKHELVAMVKRHPLAGKFELFFSGALAPTVKTPFIVRANGGRVVVDYGAHDRLIASTFRGKK